VGIQVSFSSHMYLSSKLIFGFLSPALKYQIPLSVQLIKPTKIPTNQSIVTELNPGVSDGRTFLKPIPFSKLFTACRCITNIRPAASWHLYGGVDITNHLRSRQRSLYSDHRRRKTEANHHEAAFLVFNANLAVIQQTVRHVLN
jgi:hypothetical protein